jgi:hypothetical protein
MSMLGFKRELSLYKIGKYIVDLSKRRQAASWVTVLSLDGTVLRLAAKRFVLLSPANACERLPIS